MAIDKGRAAQAANLLKRLFFIVCGVGFLHCAFNAATTAFSKDTSFPWWSSFLLTSLFYLPFLILIGLAFLIAKRKSRPVPSDMSAERLFAAYQKTHPEAKSYVAYAFCGGGPDADELLALVLAGVKRGTASSVDVYEAEGEKMPEVGDLAVILDSEMQARCIVKTVKVEICTFDEVTEEFAAREGEGDASLAYWRRAHESFFRMDMGSIGMEFTPDMRVICESFTLVYREDNLPLPAEDENE